MNNNKNITTLQQKIKNINQRLNQLSTVKPVRQTGKKANTVSNTFRRRYNSVPISSVPSWGGANKPLRLHQWERIGTITANSTAGNFKADRFEINPSNSTTFPWLSHVASLYNKYKFHKLVFTFVNNASTVTDGNVTLGVAFDALDATPASSVGMSHVAKFKTFAPWKTDSLDIPVNRNGNNTWLYCADANTTSELTTVDLKTYNLGNFFISTEGMSASAVAGYIVVEYDVELLDMTQLPN